MSGRSETGHIFQSLAVNAVIAVSKGVAAALSGSGALLAETLHSFADCGNQLLLLLGVKRSARPATREHPLGFGRDLYFWSFMVALLLFAGGGCFSIYEGIHKLQHPEPVGSITVGLIILTISIALEGWSTLSNIRELNKRRGTTGFLRYLRETKDTDLIVVFGENSAAVLGLVFAIAALVLARETSDGRWDAIGSLMIGRVLVGVALFLAKEVKSLLVGEGADPRVEQAVREVAAADPWIENVLRIMTIQQGPGEVVVAMKVKFKPGLSTDGNLYDAINAFEAKLEERVPDIKWSFIEPDNMD
jgi:cation diffusion facilitator family transporter